VPIGQSTALLAAAGSLNRSPSTACGPVSYETEAAGASAFAFTLRALGPARKLSKAHLEVEDRAVARREMLGSDQKRELRRCQVCVKRSDNATREVAATARTS
jgi:hypothetical protein